jgi:death-on-curing protein
MVKFSKEKVLLLHQMLLAETGGMAGVRDFGLLDSALSNAYQTFDGKELYTGKEEKAAWLGYSLISNHAFFDGNKRIGVYVMLSFLEVNGVGITTCDDEIISLALSVSSGKMKYADILAWIKNRE